MINLTLTRNRKELYGVFGELLDYSGKLVAVTLEHAFKQPDGSWDAAIPIGTYTCLRRLSPKFGYDVFILLGVPGHSYVEIHIGNVNSDSDGCILLGTATSQTSIFESRVAFTEFMRLLDGETEFTLHVV